VPTPGRTDWERGGGSRRSVCGNQPGRTALQHDRSGSTPPKHAAASRSGRLFQRSGHSKPITTKQGSLRSGDCRLFSIFHQDLGPKRSTTTTGSLTLRGLFLPSCPDRTLVAITETGNPRKPRTRLHPALFEPKNKIGLTKDIVNRPTDAAGIVIFGQISCCYLDHTFHLAKNDSCLKCNAELAKTTHFSSPVDVST